MEDTEQRWSAGQVLALAPDAASSKAGTKLGVPGPWSGTGLSEGCAPPGGEGTAKGVEAARADGEDGEPGGGVLMVWGLCAGSGKTPYRTVVDVTAPAFKCSCPSRKFPCKHALGLLLLWSQGREGGVAAAEPPDWVREWRAGRQATATRRRTPRAEVADPAAARRRAERRASRVAAGAAELDQRLADSLRSGLASAGHEDRRIWQEVAARMMDAQAPGLASWTRELAVIPGSGGDWPTRLLEEQSLLHLLARGYLGCDGLPEGLAATVRTRVGFTADTAELLAGPTVRDRWLVLSQQDALEGQLTTRRIWLLAAERGRAALLLGFGATGRTPELSLPVGRIVDAELAYHPGAVPLRAALGPQHGAPEPGRIPPAVAVGDALGAYGEALRADPWLDEWPVVLGPVVPVPTAHGWQLADAEGDSALPVDPRRLDRPGLWRLAAVSGGTPVTVFGSLGHRGFTPLTAWSPQAPGDPVRL
ncbi:SWIM zinc finger domain-containing protein [Streptomyces sp. PTM05]|uniref:SWIM zinc finger domain-containing protein n=1 Tax=Streptantibioticus parmotrematis TaxID=2873249 RepID=A0ABS7QL24_9ACTN|nr:SWIM zinc finger family protein [Streptantibioticus parmotrematis]MBY8883895.1 SWIM zinc finger domain-containing protein [Streptantibioticus parmotrematis]